MFGSRSTPLLGQTADTLVRCVRVLWRAKAESRQICERANFYPKESFPLSNVCVQRAIVHYQKRTARTGKHS